MVPGYIRAVLLIVAVLALGPATAVAQDSSDDGQHSGDSTKTFTLTLYGEVPRDQDFYVAYRGSEVGAPADFLVFCSDSTNVGGAEEPDLGPCQGDGTVYTDFLSPREGERIDFSFVRSREVVTGVMDEFLQGSVTIGGNPVVRAYYDFRTGQGGRGDGPGLPEPPSAGAGGTAGGGSPVGDLAGVLALLVASGYAKLRRPWARCGPALERT